jgi:translocation and assembly module TamA
MTRYAVLAPLLMAATLMLGGCAALGTAQAPAAAAAAASAAGSGTTLRLDIQAPDELKALLQRHLDLARMAALPADEALDETEWARLIGAAPAQVRQLLQTEGYFAPKVTLDRSASGEPGVAAHVTLRVDPGERIKVARFALLTGGELDRRLQQQDEDARALALELRGQWSLPAGQWFRNAAWADAKSALLARLRAAGYASAAIEGSTADIDTDQRSAQLTVVVDSGPRYLAGAIVIEGLEHHDAETVRHLAGFGPGTPLTEPLLLDYQERLTKSGLFERVTVSFEPEVERAAGTPVQVQLHEQPLQQATVGLGISANTGPRVSLEHTHRRPFGWAAIAHNKLEWGRDRQAWEGELSSHPGEGFYRNLLGGQIERLKTDEDVVLSQRLRVGRTQDAPRLERLYFVEVERATQTAAGGVDRYAEAVSLAHHLVLRRVDSIILPTQGWTLSVQAALGQSRSSYAPTGPFVRMYGRLTGYWPFGASWYGQGRIELGEIFVRKDVALPDTQGFRAGGDDSVRGYGYRTLGPEVDGVVSAGKRLATASLELARPISRSMPSLWGAVFFDAGQAANEWGDLKPVYGYGIGLRWRSPVGPLKIDWAWGEAVRKGRLHLSVGIAF